MKRYKSWICAPEVDNWLNKLRKISIGESIPEVLNPFKHTEQPAEVAAVGA